MASSKTTGFDPYLDQTLQNTLANKGSGDRQLKVRPVTTFSSIIPPPSPTYFSMHNLPERDRKPGGNLNNTGATGGEHLRDELSHLKPLPPSNVDTEEPITWYQKISIWMINEGKDFITVAKVGIWNCRTKHTEECVGATMHHVCAIYNPSRTGMYSYSLFAVLSGLQEQAKKTRPWVESTCV